MSDQKIIYTSHDARTPYWKLVEESVMAWCERSGAELVNLPAPKDYQPQWVIFDAFRDSVERGAGRFGWIDNDILVQPSAPDILGMTRCLTFCQPDRPNHVHRNMRRNYRKWGLLNPRPYIVSALAAWDPEEVRAVVEWFEENRHRFGRHIGDQELLVVACRELKLFFDYFPMHMHNMATSAKKETKFLHAAGANKTRKIQRLRRKFFENE